MYPDQDAKEGTRVYPDQDAKEGTHVDPDQVKRKGGLWGGLAHRGG